LKITVDTNVLVRAAVLDDPEQAQRAAKVLRDAEIIAGTVPALCEFAWGADARIPSRCRRGDQYDQKPP
jgi:predicted nucleic acid-binding protein